MKLLVGYLLLTVALLSVSADTQTTKFVTEKNLLILDDDNLQQAITQYGSVLVYFYVPWCTHTGKISSTLQKTYTKYYKKKTGINFGKVNA